MTDINRPRIVALVDLSYLFKRNYAAMPGAAPLEAAKKTLAEMAAAREDNAHVILCLDAPPYAERRRIYPEYKAHRPPVEEQEISQKRWLLDRAKKLGFPLARAEGWEADDVIATLARIYGEWCEEVRLIASDKDIAQCVTENIVQYVPAVGARKGEARNRLAIKAKFGVFPEQMALFLALQGDSSDNVPGVDKVGKTTAARWAAQYRTLTGLAEALAANAGNPPPKERAMWTSLANNWSTLKLSLDLVTLNANVPIDAEGLLERLAPEPDEQGYTMGSDVELDGFERNATPPAQREDAHDRPYLQSEGDIAPEDLEQERTLMSAPDPSRTPAQRERERRELGVTDAAFSALEAKEAAERAAAERAAIAGRPDLSAAAAAAEPQSARVQTDAAPQRAAANDPQSPAPARQRVTDAQFEEGAKKPAPAPDKQAPGLVKAEPNYGLVTADLQPLDLTSAQTVAKWLHHGGLYPQFNGPSAIFTVIARGKELGLGMTTALAGFHVVEGRPTASADLIRSLAERSDKCRYFRLVASTSTYAEWETLHADHFDGEGKPMPTRFRYDIEEAEAAGLVRVDRKGNPGMWQKRPRDMLAKTAGAKLARLVYPGATLGLYCPEEMGESRGGEEAA